METNDEAAEVQYQPISFDEEVLDIQFHPSRDLIAAARIGGNVSILEYSANESKTVYEMKHHKKSCRALEFSTDGKFLYTGSSDKTLAVFDMTAGKVTAEHKAEHSHPLNVLKLYDENTLVSGDEEGVVKIWDLRQRGFLKATVDYTLHTDYVADLWANPEKGHLLSVSADGGLTVVDMRKGAIEAESDDCEDELLSLAVIKNGKKIVVGSGEGMLHIFTYEHFGNPDDHFPGHPESIDSMVVIDADTICTGSSDGLIRIVQIHPNKLLGVVGEHDFPIEVIRQNTSKTVMASVSHDNLIKLWDVRYLYEADDDEEGEAADDMEAKEAAKAGPKPNLDEEDAIEQEMDVDDEEEDEMEEKKSKGGKGGKSGGGGGKKGKKGRGNNFFDDLE